MEAEEIRRMHWSNRDSEGENLFAVLREIAAQLADLKVAMAKSAPCRPQSTR
jgi:hypothetical protein